MAETRLLGESTNPIYVTGSIVSTSAGSTGVTIVSGSMPSGSLAVTEATFGSGSNSFELLHYETNFETLLGLETTASVYSGTANCYVITGINRTTGTLFMQLFDLTGGPGPGFKPICSIPVLSSSGEGFQWRTGRSVRFGLQVGWSSGYSAFTSSANAGAFYVEYKK